MSSSFSYESNILKKLALFSSASHPKYSMITYEQMRPSDTAHNDSKQKKNSSIYFDKILKVQ